MSQDDTTADRELQPDVEVFDLDPLDAIESDDYDDPTPEEITDPDHPDYVEPAGDVTPAADPDTSEEDQ